jgi:hypothetical protein
MADTVEEPAGQDEDECKIFVSRIPTAFDEVPVKRLIEEQLGEGSVVDVALVYPHDAHDEEGEEQQKTNGESNHETNKNETQREHRGFAFVTLDSVENQQEALALGTVRGGLKANSTKKHTLYLRPVVRKDGEEERKEMCFLWTNSRCPYGDECKFAHQGEGACLPSKASDATPKKKKCFAFAKGKCKLGDECPFSHDVTTTSMTKTRTAKSDHEKDCINWKTKGKCRKGDSCPYRHDAQLQEKVSKKKRQRNDTHKERQPLSIRVFGLNYDTTAEDVRSYFEHCGPIVELTFPTFEDSGRSKGYCGILFQSPKAVSNAIDLDGKELHGRWLQVQAGKMYLKQWEEQAETRKQSHDHDALGEFGQKVKKRKHRND